MHHKIKITFERNKNIMTGKKKAEVRFNDRDYQVGDTVQFYVLADYKDLSGTLADEIYAITHVHSGLGLAEGFVMLSIRKDEDI